MSASSLKLDRLVALVREAVDDPKPVEAAAVGCWFCAPYSSKTPGHTAEPDGPVCDRCQALNDDFRRWLADLKAGRVLL